MLARGDGGSASGVGKLFGEGISSEFPLTCREEPVESRLREEDEADGDGVREPSLCLDRRVTSPLLSPGDGEILARRAIEVLKEIITLCFLVGLVVYVEGGFFLFQFAGWILRLK